jgi:hypothetical protein
MLAPLRGLITELSQYGHKNDRLNAHLNIDLLPPIRAAANTGHCSLFQRILPAVAMAQNYTREVVNSLNASLVLCVEALSAAEITRTEVEREIINNDKVAGFGRVLPDLPWSSAQEDQDKIQNMQKRHSWSDTLMDAMRDVRDGRDIIGFELDRYDRLQAGLTYLTTKEAGVLDAQRTTDDRHGPDSACGVTDTQKFEKFFLEAIARAVGNDTV